MGQQVRLAQEQRREFVIGSKDADRMIRWKAVDEEAMYSQINTGGDRSSYYIYEPIASQRFLGNESPKVAAEASSASAFLANESPKLVAQVSSTSAFLANESPKVAAEGSSASAFSPNTVDVLSKLFSTPFILPTEGF